MNIKILFFSLLVSCFLFPLKGVQAQVQGKYVVVLDAGHGGKDGGASRGHYLEKKIALKLALKTGKLLSRNKEIKVIYTRKKDVFVELHKRAAIANKNHADLFVSIHCNANNSSKPHGAETHVLGLKGNKTNLEIVKKENGVILLEDDYKKNYDYDPNSPESVIGLSVLQEENLDESLSFASLVQTNFVSAKRNNRSVKQNNFLVLRETAMPSVLIELGFLSNKVEGKFLNSAPGQTKMANAIAEAIIDYIAQLKKNTLKKEVVVYQGKTTPVAKTKVASKTPKKVVKVIKKTPKKEVIVVKTPEKVAVTNKKTEKVVKKTPKNKVVTVKVSKKVAEVVKKTSKKDIIEVKVPEKVVAINKKAAEIVKNKVVVKAIIPSLQFKVQIAASVKYISETSENFKGLEGVEVLVVDPYYKYYYGSSPTYLGVKKYLNKVREAGIKGAFVVAFENGVKLRLSDALKKQ